MNATIATAPASSHRVPPVNKPTPRSS
jgi:hypothetical protein